MICPYCKETIQDEAIKCRYCGSFINYSAGQSINSDSITSDEMLAFIGPNGHYYIQRFSKFTQSGTEKFSPTWNWSCFGFTFLWMLYRKMYMQAAVTFVIFCLPGINIILHIFAGVVGNYLYYRHVKEKIIETRTVQSPQNLYPVLQEMGGIHKWVITAGIILGIIMAITFALFFSTMLAFMGHHITEMTI